INERSIRTMEGRDGHRDVSVATPSTSATVTAPLSLATATSSNVPMARPVFMPETFTGMGREWSDWKEQFEMAAVVNNWNDGMKLKFMALLLSGRARDIYSGLSVEAKRSYVLLKDALGKCFEPCETAEWNRLASSVQGNPGIYIAAKLGGCDVKLLVDTGAQVSIIPKQRWLTITNGGAPLEHHEGVVRVANGGSMLILGRWQTVCQFDSLTVITEFLVADLEPQEILLGSDFLLKYGVIINLDQKSCRLMGKQIPLL
uniref:Peptidase A2 domain-containing protein n=1 Tax=Cyprinus carpio TaxID=7962 RepID=A0A8C1PY10_CYPCA